MPPLGYEPFLRAICDSPDDDVPRLVYADWLDENGDPDRAEFIRVQIADPGRADRPDVKDREFELRDRNRKAWRAELPLLMGVTWGRFRRGFVSGATFEDWRSFHRQADAVFAAAPIDELRFANLRPGQWHALLASPHFTRVRRLSTGLSRLGDAELRALAHHPRADRLEQLTFGGYEREELMSPSLLTDDAAMGFAWTECLPGLRRLELNSDAVSDGVLAALRLRYGPDMRVIRRFVFQATEMVERVRHMSFTSRRPEPDG